MKMNLQFFGGRGGGSGMSNRGGASGTFVEITGGTYIADFGGGTTATVGLAGDSGKWNASLSKNGKTQFSKDFDSKKAAMNFIKNNT